MKKVIAVSLVLCVLSSALSACKTAGHTGDETTTFRTESTAEEPHSAPESPVSDFEYEVNEEGGITIIKYIGKDADVVIPAKMDGKDVIWIGVSAFAAAKETLRSIVFPDSVISISGNAFQDCTNLSEIQFGNNLKGIDLAAFRNCTSLTKIDLSSPKFERIFQAAFDGCTNLNDVILGDNIVSIGNYAFSNCTSLKNVNLPKNLEELGEGAFSGCSALQSITIPKALTSWGWYAFMDNASLSQVIFKDGLERIGGYGVFGNCESLTEMTIPASVNFIVQTTFFLPNLTKIVFLGDCPYLDGETKFPPDIDVYYDPNTSGWDTCNFRDECNLIPLTQN